MDNRYLFRGVDAYIKKWRIGFLIIQKGRGVDGSSDSDITQIVENGSFQNVDPKTIGQCTGLKDKNGALIFEGDVCTSESGIKTIVSFLEGSFRHTTEGSSLSSSISTMWVDMYRIEITGSIHDEA